MHNHVLHSLKGVLFRTQGPWPSVMLLHTPVFLDLYCRPLYLWAPETEAFPVRGVERKLEDSTFLYSTQYSVTYLLLGLSPLPPLPPSPMATRSIRWQESFGSGSLASEIILHVFADLAKLH